MAANMYRVGDYVYFETSSTSPYQIRRIEELNKTPSGNVEAKVMCFYRRRDISSSLILLADRHQMSDPALPPSGAIEDEQEEQERKDDMIEKERHQLKHRELFLSRQVETLPATHIRGKCTVTLLNETESLSSYLNREDGFFYSLVYDPQQKTLLADKGEIRVGSRYQAELASIMRVVFGENDNRKSEDLETLVWSPESSNLTDRQIDQFMVTSRSVGTFARALDCTSTVRQPSLHMSAAAASRDVTLFHAMDTLHKHQYDISKAIASLVPHGGPVLCRDEMEEWSASEANLFEEALDKYGKDFIDIRQDFLPWKSLKSIVEYYYMWKTTDRYVQQKRIKAAEAESKLKQVYIPNYNKPNPAQITKPNGADGCAGRACESCYTSNSGQWYAWGPVHMNCRLCAACWVYWKKYGGLKMPTRLGKEFERLAHLAATRVHRCTISGCGKEFKLKTHLARHLQTAHGLAIPTSGPRPITKTRAAFCLITTPLTRASRQICVDILKIFTAARRPFYPINIASIKQECQVRLQENSKPNIHQFKPKIRGTLDKVAVWRGIDIKGEKPALLHRAEKPPKPLAHVAFPKPAIMPEFGVGSSVGQPSIMKKRGYEHTMGADTGGPPFKRTPGGVIRQAGSVQQSAQMLRGSVINSMNGRAMNKSLSSRGRKHIMNWTDAPDDVYFVATDATRKLRKQLNFQEFRRAARVPWRKLNVAGPVPASAPTASVPAASVPVAPVGTVPTPAPGNQIVILD